MTEQRSTSSRLEVRVHPVYGWLATRWGPDERWQFAGGTSDGEVVPDEQIEEWTPLVPQAVLTKAQQAENEWIQAEAGQLLEQVNERLGRPAHGEALGHTRTAGLWPEQEGVTPEAEAQLVGPVDSQPHDGVQAELRRIQVAVRGQMDGIRPIEAAVLTYAWFPPVEHRGETLPAGWTFEGMETLVQGLDGSLKPGTPLSASDWAKLGPALGWVWDLVQRHRPRG